MLTVLLPVAAWLVAGTATATLHVVVWGMPVEDGQWGDLMASALLWPLYSPCLVAIVIGRRILERRERKPEGWDELA